MKFYATSDIISCSERLEGAQNFFSFFSDAWANAKSQVWKLERQQHYDEPDSESWRLAMDGNLEEAIKVIPLSRSTDLPLYEDIAKRKVEFTRCHPILFPKTPYIDWELEVYKFNSSYGERIFCCNYDSLSSFLDEIVHHDFMIFDSNLAFIHNYSEDGKIMGGWKVCHQDHIRSLLATFSYIKANSQDFSFYTD